jgi:hypothetical protein
MTYAITSAATFPVFGGFESMKMAGFFAVWTHKTA